MNFYTIFVFIIVDGESKRDYFEEEIKDRIGVLRRCGQILETELITKEGLNDCMSRTILHRAKRSLKCYACQKTSLFITKEVKFLENSQKFTIKFQTLEYYFQNWNILSLDSRPVQPRSLIDIGECYGHCRGTNIK